MSRLITLTIIFFLTLGLTAQGIYSEEDIKLQRLYIQANQYKLLAKYDKAIELYEKIIEEQPLNAAAQHDLARVLLATESYDKAIKAAKNAVKYEPKNVWYQLTLSDVYEANDNCTNAATILGKVAKSQVDNDLYRRWFRAHVVCENWQGGLQVTDDAMTTFGFSLTWLDESVNMLMELGKEKEAVKRLQKHLERDPSNLDLLERLTNLYVITGDEKRAAKLLGDILEIDPGNEYASYQKAKIENQSSNDDQALMALVRDDRLDLDYKIKSLIPALQSATERAQIDMLIQCADQLILNYPEDAKPYALKGDLHMMIDDFTIAIESYEQTIAIDKSNYEVWSQLLFAYLTTGSYDQLSLRSEQAIDYYPNQSGPYLYYAVAGLELDHIDQATEYLEEYRFIGSDEPFMIDLSYLLEGKIYQTKGDIEGGISIIQGHISQSNSQSPQLFELLGDLYLDKGDKAQSEKYWRQAIEKGGNAQKLNTKIESI